jgi:hypothetical protein
MPAERQRLDRGGQEALEGPLNFPVSSPYINRIQRSREQVADSLLCTLDTAPELTTLNGVFRMVPFSSTTAPAQSEQKKYPMNGNCILTEALR